MSQARLIRTLLVDDQPLVRAGLKTILSTDPSIDVIGEAADGVEAVDLVRHLAPDVVVMDVRMPRLDGAEATRRIHALHHAPPVLILTTFDDDDVLSSALRAGAAGFLLKDAPGEDILRAIRAVANGEAFLDAKVTARVLATYRSAPTPASLLHRMVDLTDRELDVLRLIGRGASNDEIAAELVISIGTVKTHITHILRKLDLRDRAAAIVFAFDQGIVEPE